MLCVKLKAFTRACGPTTGGVARVYIFDRDDFDFTQAAAGTDGDLPAYDVITRRTGATAAGGALMYQVTFDKDSAEYKYTQSRKGSTVKYEHSIEMLLADISQFITQWNVKVDAAAACCGIGLIVELRSGKIFVLGEKYVNGALAGGDWFITQDGSSGTSGKLYDDQNGQTTILKGDYSRSAYEFSGGIADIDAFTTV